MQNLTPVRAWGHNAENKLNMEGCFFKINDLDSRIDLPTPKDPEVIRAMVRKGQFVFLMAFFIASLLLPVGILLGGTMVLWLTDIPICGSVGHLEYLGDSICGSDISWEFWLGVSCLFLAFSFFLISIPHLFVKFPKTRQERFNNSHNIEEGINGP